MGEIGDSLLYYSTHEIVHAVKEISRESYEMMRDTVIDLMDITKEEWDRWIDEVFDRYEFRDRDGEVSPGERTRAGEKKEASQPLAEITPVTKAEKPGKAKDKGTHTLDSSRLQDFLYTSRILYVEPIVEPKQERTRAWLNQFRVQFPRGAKYRLNINNNTSRQNCQAVLQRCRKGAGAA